MKLSDPGMLFSRNDLIRLIWPLIVEQTLAITVGLADSMMVASVGETAVSGVSLVDMISVLLINIFAALATGGAVVTSQFIGAKDRNVARRSADQLMLATLTLSLLITVLVLVFRHSLLSLFFGRVEPAVMEDCLTYIGITAPSYPFIALYNSAAAIFRAQGNSRLSMKVSLLMNAINLGGNAILIFALHMGVAGVAIPTLVSRFTAASVMVALLYRPDAPLRLSRPSQMRPDRRLIGHILTIGIPNAVENGMFQFGKIIVVSMLSAFPTAQITANAMANNIAMFGILCGQSVALAIITVTGRCVGAQDLAQARFYALRLTLTGLALNTAVCAALHAALPVLLRLYSASEAAGNYVWQVVTLHGVSVPLFWAWSFILPGTLRACNDVRYTSIVAILSMWFIRVGCSWLLGVRFGWGVVGVWAAMILDWVIRAVFYIGRFLSGGWKKHATFQKGVLS